MAYNKSQKLQDNIAAIKLVLQLSKEGRTANVDERAVLRRYSGFGGLKFILNPASSDEDKRHWKISDQQYFRPVRELYAIIHEYASDDNEERAIVDSVKRSVNTAFYTPGAVIDAIASVFKERGVEVRTMLDPSAGIGKFGDSFKQAYDGDIKVSAFEKDVLTGKILSALNPNDQVTVDGFETIPAKMQGSFDLATSNIPFGDIRVMDDEYRRSKNDAKRYSVSTIHNYFFLKALDQVREGGFVAFITSRGFMDSPSNNPIRQEIAKNARLVGAFRLPDGMFRDEAGTDVGSDLVVLQKVSGYDMSLDPETQAFCETSKGFKAMSGEDYTDITMNTFWWQSMMTPDAEVSVSTNMMRGTDPYGKPTLVFTHDGGMDGISKQLKEYFSRDLHREYIDYYQEHAPKIEAAVVEQQPEQQVQRPVEDIAVSQQKPLEQQQQPQGRPQGRSRGQAQQQAQSAPVQLDLFAMWDELDAGNGPSKEEVQAQEAERAAQEAARREAERKRLEPRAWVGDYKEWYRDGTVVVEPNTHHVGVLTGNTFTPLANLTADQTGRLRQYVLIRDAYHELYNTEAELREEQPDLREVLNRHYDNFFLQYGRLNERRNARVIMMDALGRDGLTLENEGENRDFVKADIFERPVSFISYEITHVDNPEEALSASLNRYGRVNLEYMAGLTGHKQEEIPGLLKGQIYYMPDGSYEIASKALSGNVYEKLAYVSEALDMIKDQEPGDDIDASIIPALEETKAALQAVIPEQIAFDDIGLQFGERWIPTEYYEEYISKLFDTKIEIHYAEHIDEYSLKAEDRWNLKIREEFCVRGEYKDYDGMALLAHAFHNTTPDIQKCVGYDENGDDLKGPDMEKIQLANTKIEEIRDGFTEYLTNLPKEKRDELQEMYNRKFNCFVKAKYDGSYQTFPGIDLKALASPKFNIKNIYKSQKDCVKMILENGGGICDHEVGTGKSLIMCMAAHEMHRLGIANKPMIIAMKANVAEIAATYQAAFPDDKILYASEKDFSPANRVQFFSRIKNNDYACVIMSHDQFGKIPQAMEVQQQILQDEIRDIDEALDVIRQQGGNISGRMLTGLEKRKENMEVKLMELQSDMANRKDDFVDFGRMGIDHIFIDESHQFKNLMFTTRHQRVSGLGNPSGSQKALNLLYAIRTIQNRTGKDLGATFLSGTTISNSLTELYLLFKYLRPEAMAKQGIHSFDAWAAVYAKKTSDYEFSVTNAVVQKERFRYFVKVPELATFYNENTDYRTGEDVGLDRPNMNVILHDIEPTADQKDFNERLVQFAQTGDGELIFRAPLNDREMKGKMLIATDASRKASLDMRLISPELFGDDPNNKASHCARLVSEYYQKFNEQKGTQFVFSDLSTYKPGEWNIFQEIKDKLVNDYGIPAHEIRFIQEAKNQKQREQIIKGMNDGTIRVLFGSTSTLGTGVNAQQRAVAVHHIDIPWRPSDLEQRNGRARRTGNWVAKEFAGNNVDIIIYAVKRTLDSYKFNLLQNKQLFITQLKTNQLGTRVIDEGAMDEENGMNFAEYVAILSGNDDLLQKAKLEKKILALESERKTYMQARRDTEWRLENAREKLGKNEVIINGMTEDYERYQSQVKQGEDGTPLPGLVLNNISEFTADGVYNIEEMGAALQDAGRTVGNKDRQMGSVYGFPLMVDTIYMYDEKLRKEVYAGNKFYVKGNYLYEYNNGKLAMSKDNRLGAVRYGVNALEKIPGVIAQYQERNEKLRADIAEYERIAGKPWGKEDELKGLKKEMEALDAKIRESLDETTKNMPKVEEKPYKFSKEGRYHKVLFARDAYPFVSISEMREFADTGSWRNRGYVRCGSWDGDVMVSDPEVEGEFTLRQKAEEFIAKVEETNNERKNNLDWLIVKAKENTKGDKVHQDNEVIFAAREALQKQGVDWQNAQEPAKGVVPTQEELETEHLLTLANTKDAHTLPLSDDLWHRARLMLDDRGIDWRTGLPLIDVSKYVLKWRNAGDNQLSLYAQGVINRGRVFHPGDAAVLTAQEQKQLDDAVGAAKSIFRNAEDRRDAYERLMVLVDYLGEQMLQRGEQTDIQQPTDDALLPGAEFYQQYINEHFEGHSESAIIKLSNALVQITDEYTKMPDWYQRESILAQMRVQANRNLRANGFGGAKDIVELMMNHVMPQDQQRDLAKMRVYSAGQYGGTVMGEELRTIAHQVKEYGTDSSVRAVVDKMIGIFNNIPNEDLKKMVLIPMPGASGYPGYMESVVNELGERTGLQTANSLFSTEHEPLYDLKKNGTVYEQLPDIKFEMDGTLPAGTIAVLVDNVLDTGKTLSQASKVDFGDGVEVRAAVLAHTDNYQEHNPQMEVKTIPQLREEMSALLDQRKAARKAGYEAAVAALEVSQQGADAAAVEEMKRLLNVSWNSPFGGKDAKEQLNTLGVDWQTGEAIVSSAADHVSFQFVTKDYVSTVTDSEKDMMSLVAMDLMSGNYLLGRRRPDGYRELMAEIGGAFAAVKTLSLTARQRDLLVALSGQYHEGYAELASQADVSEDVLKEALSRVDGVRHGVVTQIMTQPYHIYHEDDAFVLDYEHGFGLAGNLVEQVAKVHDGEIFERAGRKMVLFDSERNMQGFIDNIRTLNVTYTNDLRDTLIGRLRAAGISVNTDWQEGKRVLAQVTGVRERQAYGFVHNGTIYIDPRIATAETPLHEYTHLWAEVLRQRNPKEWQNIVQMMKDTPEVWNYVKQNYPHLKIDDQIADEALAQFSGKRGYKKLQELVDGKQDSDTIMGKLMEALAKFWNHVAEFFGIHYTNKEEVADRILYDFLNEVNPLDYKLNNIEGIRENQESQIESDNFKKWFGDWYKPSIYRAYMVDDVAGLKDHYPSELPNKFYDHSTVTYGLQAMDDREGQQKRMHIIGRLTTDKVDVLVVDNPESNNKYAHITLATAEGVKPVESNAELEKHAADIVPLDDYVDVTFKNVLNRNLSKVVDADGKPLAVEHGTHADFTVFDINKIGSNSKDNGLFGAGFYFGTHAPAWLNDGSEDYRTMKVYLDIKHPFEVNDKASLDIYSEIVEKMDSPAMRGLTITDLNGKQMLVGEYIDVIKAVDDVIKHNPVHVNGQIAHDDELQSYHPKDRQRIWREHEISKLSGMGALGMSWQVVISEQIGSIQFTEAAKKDGYDGVIVDRGEGYKEYVAFEPTQIKSATENVGLFNKENADIRFHFIGEQGAKNLDVAMGGGMYISNLRHAERLEKIGRSPLDIKIDTGWERGADGQWRFELPSFTDFDAAANLEWLRRHPDTSRYLELLRKENAYLFGGFAPLSEEERVEYERLRELPDNKYWKPGVTMKNPDRLTLEDFVSSPLLFMAYPELRHVVMRVEEMEDRGAYATRKSIVDGSDIHYIRLNKDMVEGARGLNVSSRQQMKSTIAHEVQHYIQDQEGFARGNDIRRINGASDFELNLAAWDGFVQQEVGQEPTYDMIMSYLKDEQYSNWRKDFGPGYQDMMKDLVRMSDTMDADTFMKNYEYFRDNGLKGEAWTQYWKSMGEVESRNVQARMGMSMDQRRHTLAVETEDVPREEQILNDIDSVNFVAAEVVPMNAVKADVGYKNSLALQQEVESVSRRGKVIAGYEDPDTDEYVFVGNSADILSRYQGSFGKLLYGDDMSRSSEFRVPMSDGKQRGKFDILSANLLPKGYSFAVVGKERVQELLAHPELAVATPEQKPAEVSVEQPVQTVVLPKVTSAVQLDLFADSQEATELPTATVDNDLSKLSLPALADGEHCYVERRYTESGAFSFVGSDHVETSDDVAYIFKSLADKSVENSFICMVKDGVPTVIHLGIGSSVAVMAPIEQALVAYAELKPDKIWFIHNHPSGSLKVSREDINLQRRMVEIFGGVAQPGIIINTTSGKFVTYTHDTIELEESQISTLDNGNKPVKVWSFDRQVFSKDWNPEKSFKAVSPAHVAAFISSHRFGEHDKLNLLITNQNSNVTGNIFLPWTDIKDACTPDGVALIARYVQQMGGTGCFLYGSDNAMIKRETKSMNYLSAHLNQYSINLRDVMSVANDNYYSAHELGVLAPYASERSVVQEQAVSPETFKPGDIIITLPDSTGACKVGRVDKVDDKLLHYTVSNGHVMVGQSAYLELANDWRLATDDEKAAFLAEEQRVLATESGQEQQRRQSQSYVAPRRLTLQDREAGGAMVDHLQTMGITVHTDNRENRRVLKAAEKDQSEAGKIRHFKTETGESYGFSYKGEIYLDLRKLDAELPLHEYAHLFCQAMQRINPDNWNHVVGLLKQDAETWDAVKRIYPELTTDNDIAEEVIAQYSGKRGAEKLQAELERMTPRDANYGSRWGNIFQNVAKAIQDFWKHIGDSMNFEYSSKEDIADQILNDFAKKVNPVKKMERWLEERDKEYAAAVERGDTDKARELFNAAMQEHVGNGVTPFIAVDGYRGKMDRLARAVKSDGLNSVNIDAINEAADLMAPMVPDNAVLVPAPSHKGYATDMLLLANAIGVRTNSEVADVLKSAPRDSQYDHKINTGKPFTAEELGIHMDGELSEGKFPVIIDNVVNTGNTAEACVQALGGGLVLSLASATSQERHVASLKSASPIVYDKQGQLIPLSERFELKNKWLGRVMNYKPLDGDVQQPVVKEPDVIQGLEGYSVDDVKSYVENSINEILEDAGLSDDITIKNITVVGSRSRGEAHEGSDLDILFEYEGNFREDALFDILHEEGLDLEGITIDINPINPHYSLTTEQWLARDAQWREEDRQKNAALSAEKDNNKSINIRSMQTSVIKSNLQVLADRLLPGTQSRVRFLKPQDPDRPSAVGGEIYRREDGIHVFRENQDVPLSSIDDRNELTDLYRSLLEYSIAERIGNGNGMNFPDSPNIDGYEISVAAVVDGNLRVMGTRDGDQANNSSYITMEGLEELIGIIDKRVAEVENIRDFDAVALHESNYQAFALAASALKSKVNEPNTLYDNIIAIGDMPPTVEHLEEWASEQMDLLRRGDADSVRVNELSNGKYRKFLSAVSAYLPEEDVKRLIDGIAAQRNSYSENHIIDQYDKVISHYQVHAPEGALADDVVSLLAVKDGVALMNWVRDSHNHDYSEPLQQLKAMLSTKTVYQADQITAAIQERDLQEDHRAQVERSLPKSPIEQSYAFVMGYYINNVLKMSDDEKALFKRLDCAHSVDAYQRWASDVRVGGALQGLSDMPEAIRADVLALANQIIETKDDVLKDEIIDALDGIGIVNQFRKVALAQQYEALKAQYPDETILFRNGQAFSAYGDDVDAIQGQTGWYGQTVGEKGQQFRWMNISHDGYNVLADKEINLRVVTPNVNIRPLAALFDEKMGAAMQTIDYSLSLGGDKPVLVDTDGSLVISEKDSDFKVKTLDFHTTGLTAISDEGKELVVRDIPKNYYHPQATLVVADYINGHRQTIEHPLEASQPVSAEMQAKQTQLLVSYKDIKAAHKNEVVLFRQKGFFEAFGQDADQMGEKFGVPVYERNLGGEDVHFVMIPTEKYASALEDEVDLDLFVAKALVDESRRDIRSNISLNEQIAVEHDRAKLAVSVTPIDNEGRYQIEVFNPDTKLAYNEPMELSKEDAEKFRSLEGMEHLSERSDLVMALANKYFSKELEMSDALSQVTKTYDNMGMSYTPLMLLQTIDFKPNQTAEVEHYNAVSVDPPYIMLYETMDDAEKSMSPRMLTDLPLDLQQSVLEQLKGGMFNEMQQEVAEHFEQSQEQHINIDDQLERVGQLTKELGLEYVPFSTRLPITVPADTEVDWREEDKVFTEVMCNGDNVTIYQNHQDSYDDSNGVDLYDLPKDLQKEVLDLMEEKLTDGDRQMTVYVDTAQVPEYAVGAIVNGDNTGLTDESIEMVREFTSQYPNHIFSVRDNSTSFNSSPAFGKATDCVDVDIVRIATPKQLRQEVVDKQTEKLQERFNDFVKEHGEEPLYAEVTIRFKDDNVQEVAMIKLSEEVDSATDNKIFFNVDNFEGLKDLLKVDNGEDFDVIDIEDTQFYGKSLYQTQEKLPYHISYGDDPTGVIEGDVHVQFTKELAYVSFEDFKHYAEDLGGSVRMMNNERWADFFRQDDAEKFANTVVDVNVSRMEAARAGAKEQRKVTDSQDRDTVLAEVKEKISQTENKEYSPDDVTILKEAAIAHIEKYNSDYYQAKGVDIKGMIESSEVTDRHSLSAAVASVVFDIHSEALGRESGILERLLPNDMGRADETFMQSRDASAAAEAILDLRQNNLKDALDTKVAEVNTTLAEYNRLSQAADPNFMQHSHVENYALEQQSENEFALTDSVERKFATSWMGARELLAHLVNLLQKMFEKFPELKPSHEDKVEESPEQHVDAEEQAHAEKSDGDKKTSKWDNLDYTKYVLPEGADVTHKRWKFIKPKDGEQYGKYHIMCDFNGEHYEREMYGNDIKVFFEKDETGQRTNRVTLDQLVAKYFGKQFAESMSIGSVQEAEHVRAEQEDAKDQAVNDKKQQAQQQAENEKEAAQQKAAEEKKAAEEAAKKKAEEEQKSEKKVKVPAIILQSTLLIDALLAAKAADGVWLNKEAKGAPILYQAGTPSVSAFNGLMMALHSDAHGYKSNDYTTFNVAKGDGYHVKGGENGLPFNWYKWDKYVNRFNANEVIDKAAYDALAPEEKELYKVQRIKEERSIFNIDQTTMPEVKKESYNFILESQDKDSVYRGAEESSVQPFSLPKQFVDLKEKHPEAILLMRDGNSYNIYGEDADKLSGLLGLDVKDHDPEGNEIKFATFPYHALDINLPKMIRAGYRVAICDQIGDIRSSQRHGAADAIYNKAVALEDALVKLSGDTNKVMKEPFFETTYDGKDDTLRFADCRYSRPGNEIVTALQRVNDSFRAAAAYTGGESRLNRVAYSTMLPGDTEKYDRLVSELAAGVLMSRAGLPATLSKESMALVPYWVRELKESPKLMESVERDVNNAVEVLEKIKAGETVDYGAIRGEKAFDAIRPKLYTIANELATIPDAEAKIVVVVKDQQKKSAAVILPAGASLEVNNEIPGLNKNRFLIALRKQGFENVQFYNAGGALGLNQSNEFFADKTVEIAKLKQYDLNVVENIDLSEEIERSLKVDLKQVQVTFDDNMRPLLYVKPVDDESFTVYPEPSDVKLFFDNVRSPEFDTIRENLGQKYYGLVSRHPDLKTDVLMPKVSSDIDLSRISKVNITKDRYKPESTIIFATIDGQQQKPIELNQIEAQRYWLVDDKNLYKLLLAAQHFEEQLNNTNGQSEDGQNQFHDCHEGSGVGSSSSSAEVSTDGQEDKQERKGGIRM